ncbi:MAG: hypothetical protein CL927_17260 [Deltaproteobacteria bacterium]|nr:hypothetical protein [Deltaproteobacteria bacterium]
MSDVGPSSHPGSPGFIAQRVAQWGRDGRAGPVTLEIYPTLSCNLDCSFCDTTDRHRPPVDELSTERWLRILDEGAAMGVRRVFVLGGGEPLARRDCPRLLQRITDLKLEGILTTNGTLLTAAIAHQLVETGWSEVHVSIDGPDSATHDGLRGRPGAFRRTVRNTCRLGLLARRAGAPLKIAIHFVITRNNWTSLPEMVRLAESLGATRIDFDDLIAYTPEQKALALSPHERARLPAVAQEAMRLAEDAGIATTLAHYARAPRPERGQTQVEGTGGKGVTGAPCLKAWHHLVVQADGRTSPCCVLAGSGGSVRETSLDRVWSKDPFLTAIRSGMWHKRPHARCGECSPNILGHEAAIRDALPDDIPRLGEPSVWT